MGQASAVPGELVAVPAGHCMQLPLPAAEYSPAGHGVQEALPAVENSPAGHGVQEALPAVENSPAGQVLQEVLVIPGVYLPAAHWLQEVAAEHPALYRPGPQLQQDPPHTCFPLPHCPSMHATFMRER